MNPYKAAAVHKAIAADMSELPPALRESLTWDRGREMAEHQELAADLALDVCFCNPHRGNEARTRTPTDS